LLEIKKIVWIGRWMLKSYLQNSNNTKCSTFELYSLSMGAIFFSFSDTYQSWATTRMAKKYRNILHSLQHQILTFFSPCNFQLFLESLFSLYSIRFHASVLTSGGGTAKQTSSSIILFVLLHAQSLLSPFIDPILLSICLFVP